jgi:putative tricarboxylic transport membrane protein
MLTIVAPAAPGGGWDQTARVLQQVWTRVEPGASVQVENVPGAAGTIGLARFVSGERGNPDALLVTGLVMVSAIVTNHSPVTLADTTPIARLTGEYEVIAVPADSKWRTLRELIDAFRSGPASVAWGGGSAGGTDDLLVRLIASDVGVLPSLVNYIAFPGGGAALAAVMGAQVSAGVSGYGEFAAQIHAGTLRVLAVSAPARVSGIDAPTLREQGIAVDLANWRGIVAPPGLTDAERDRLTDRLQRVVASSGWKQMLERNGWADLLLTGPAFRQFLLSEQGRIEQVLRALSSGNTGRASALHVTPMTLPRITMGALALLLTSIVARRGSRTISRRAHGPWRQRLTSLWSRKQIHDVRPLMLVAALLVYAFAMPLVGFVPASVALFVVAARLLGSRRPVRDAIIGTAAATLLFVAFTQGLGLDLPRDPLTR